VSDDAATVLREGRKAAAALVARRRQRFAEHAIDVLPGCHEVRALDRSHHPARGIEHLTGVEHHAEVAHLKAQGAEVSDEFGLGEDAGAAAGQFSLDALEHIDVPTASLQHERCQEPAHRAADDERAPSFARSALGAARARGRGRPALLFTVQGRGLGRDARSTTRHATPCYFTECEASIV
jgi:hypothetical protein